MLSFLPFVREARAKSLFINPLAGLAVGAAMALMVFSHMLAISMVEAAYMISIKRTSIVFGVLLIGWFGH